MERAQPGLGREENWNKIVNEAGNTLADQGMLKRLNHHLMDVRLMDCLRSPLCSQ
jgi:hypothetical protein